MSPPSTTRPLTVLERSIVQSVDAPATPKKNSQAGTDGDKLGAERRLATSCRTRPAARTRPISDDTEPKRDGPTDRAPPNGISAANIGSVTRIGSRRHTTRRATTNGATATTRNQDITPAPPQLTGTGRSPRPRRPSSPW